ncbi:MAG TPA: acetoin utilization protein AcuC [Candidatus Limnocylindria bacterium]|nr:acetoin utilization protein AcuC [Candidatus Limnocylindria bacterium]
MSERVAFVWDESLAEYDFGPTHPLAPIRVQLAVRLARDLRLLEDVTVLKAPRADDALLELVHTRAYLDAVRVAAAAGPPYEDLAHGLGTDDVPVFAGMHDASAHVVGATVEATRAVLTGGFDHAVNLAGGLHHAMPEAASGFCVYNDPAIAIRWALEHGVERVAYVDVDVHHGDGVERTFWDEPRVLTISMHESAKTLFPGTGWPNDVGGPGAEGLAVNVGFPPKTDDDGWLRAFDAIVPALLERFRPQLLVTQHGCDSHILDPLGHLRLTVDGQRASYARLHRLAHLHAGGRWVAVGGGGYAIVDVVPRAWAHLVGEIVGRPVVPTTLVPPVWVEHVTRLLGRRGMSTMSDGREPRPRPWADGWDVEDPVDRAVIATRAAVFPLHGLDPHLDL